MKRLTTSAAALACGGLLALLALAPAGCTKKKTEPAAPPTPPATQPGDDESADGGPVERVRLAAARSTDSNNLKQIALAMHIYGDSNQGALPPAAICDKQGKPLLSWRVAILPYIEEIQLYQQFKLDEPWDSPNNKKLIAQMPKTYLLPLRKEEASEGLTHYRVFVGLPKAGMNGLTAFDAPGPQTVGPQGGVRLFAMKDGTSNTLLVVESADPAVWTKPEELVYDPNKPVPKLGFFFGGKGNIALADGSVRLIDKGIAESTLRKLITREDGEVFQPGELD